MPHDAKEPSQFAFEYNKFKFVYLTDLGHITEYIISQSLNANVIFLEFNYDNLKSTNLIGSSSTIGIIKVSDNDSYKNKWVETTQNYITVKSNFNKIHSFSVESKKIIVDAIHSD